MRPVSLQASEVISDELVQQVGEHLLQNKAIRIRLPKNGCLSIDRQLPFLCVYRRPEKRWDEGTEYFVVGQASYLIVPEHPQQLKNFSKLFLKIVSLLAKEFGAFLILEIWSAPDKTFKPISEGLMPKPIFRIIAPKNDFFSPTVNALKAALLKSRILKRIPMVEEIEGKVLPQEEKPFLTPHQCRELNCHSIGLEVEAVYRNLVTRERYPLVERALARSLSRAFKQAFFKFIRTQTTDRPKHYQALGKRVLVKAVWDIDRKLSAISDSFDMLLHLNPVNAHIAWLQFKREKYQRDPVFIYPPLSVDPSLLKRKLFEIPLERVEDPVVAEIFWDKTQELDRLITMLSDRGSRRFLYGSLQLFGGVEDSLLDLAQTILGKVPSRTREDLVAGSLGAEAFSVFAKKEIEKYRRQFSQFQGSFEIREGPSSLMVSNGTLYIGSRIKIPRKRVDALLQHEVGTHMVTYYNARAQPFQLLHAGLAGYDELQEGLAVLAEYLCGGLSRPRLRLLAARVVATKRLIQGASFVEIFRELDRNYDFERKTAFTITLRVFRGGGLTKDADYLRGLMSLLKNLKEGEGLETLFMGKFALRHVPIIKDLRWRQVLKKPPLKPFYLKKSEAKKRLEILRQGLSVLDLIEESKK